MTIDEASTRYNIPLDILREYESWGLCGAVKKVMGTWQYDDQDIERLSMNPYKALPAQDGKYLRLSDFEFPKQPILCFPTMRNIRPTRPPLYLPAPCMTSAF